MTLKVFVQPDDNGGYVAEVPAFSGCRSQGRMRDDAINNVRQALEAWLEAEQSKGPVAADETAAIELTVGPARDSTGAARRSVLQILRDSPGGQMFKSSAEVDQYLREEHAAWDR